MMSLSNRYHRPALLEEVLQLFHDVPSGRYLDVTLGGGGHTEAILDLRADLDVVALDRDEDAIEVSSKRLERFQERVCIVRSDMKSYVQAISVQEEAAGSFSAILADLGVSSHHFDEAARGFSFSGHTPLDMRMDKTDELSAIDVVNKYSQTQLIEVLKRGGDVQYAGRIAREVVEHRPIFFTDQLAQIVSDAIPKRALKGRLHPATTVFQAIRIEVNGEFEQLDALLTCSRSLLATSGMLIVISYHSGEDRMVKEFMRDATTDRCSCPPKLPCVCGKTKWAISITRNPLVPSAQEIKDNPRARSAKLRAMRKVELQEGSR